MEFVEYLTNPNNKLMTTAESYCLVRPMIKKFLKEHKDYQKFLIEGQKEVQHLLNKTYYKQLT